MKFNHLVQLFCTYLLLIYSKQKKSILNVTSNKIDKNCLKMNIKNLRYDTFSLSPECIIPQWLSAVAQLCAREEGGDTQPAKMNTLEQGFSTFSVEVPIISSKKTAALKLFFLFLYWNTTCKGLKFHQCHLYHRFQNLCS